MYEIRFDERGVCATGSMAELSDRELKRIRFSLLKMAGKIQNFIVERGGELQAPTTLTPEILLKNGWEQSSMMIVLKTPIVRLGWNPKTKLFVIGYGQLPRPITEVEQLMMVYKLCGLYDLIEQFQL